MDESVGTGQKHGRSDSKLHTFSVKNHAIQLPSQASSFIHIDMGNHFPLDSHKPIFLPILHTIYAVFFFPLIQILFNFQGPAQPHLCVNLSPISLFCYFCQNFYVEMSVDSHATLRNNAEGSCRAFT